MDSFNVQKYATLKASLEANSKKVAKAKFELEHIDKQLKELGLNSFEDAVQYRDNLIIKRDELFLNLSELVNKLEEVLHD